MFPILLIAFAAVAYGGYLFTKASDVAAGSKEELSRGDQSKKELLQWIQQKIVYLF